MWRSNSLLIAVLGTSLFTVQAHDHAHEHGSDGLEFHANKGQWPDQVLFRTRTTGGALFVERSALTYVVASGGPIHGQLSDPNTTAPYKQHAYKVHFENGLSKGHEGLEPRSHHVNYFLGNDPSAWATRVGVFRAVRLHEVYPGIALHVDGHDGLKYDWLLAPGAAVNDIVMRFEGHEDLRVENGLLYIGTSAGEVLEQRPVAWQQVNGERVMVPINYRLDLDRLRFELPAGYDPALPLVIDPVVTFSSYSGSTADNFGLTATYDDEGHLYAGGSAFGFGYPTSLGAVQTTFGGGTVDMGISKFSPDGSTLVWSTYIGGSANDIPHSMVVNSQNELFILGTTGSFDLPVTSGCFDATFGGGALPPFGGSYGFTYSGGSDMAVIHLQEDATALIGSTYVGGSGNDGLNQFTPLLRNYGDPFRGEIIMDLEERPVIATSTISADLFTTPGAPQSAWAGGLDAYICRLDPSLTTMLWATYHGGSGNDAGFGVQVASNGELYVTGGTASANLPTAGVPFAAAFSGIVDGFIARYSPTGDALISATFLGTTSFDQSYFVQLDTQDNVYVVGQTAGAFPVSQGVYANPTGSQFIQKFSADLSASIWSTRIGSTGNENISPSAFLVSDCGQIYFSGWGGSTNPAGGGVTTSSTLGLPVTQDAFDSTTDGSDFYLMVLNADAESLAYATFFGGTAAEHVDGGTSRFDKDGVVYQAVCAGCGGLTFPTTPGAYSTTNNSFNCNLGVFKIDFEQNVQVNIDADVPEGIGCVDDPVVLTAIGTADEWTWDLGDGSPLVSGPNLDHTYAEPGTYTVTLVGTATGLCVATDTAFAEITVVAPAVMDARFDALATGNCDAFQVELFNLSTGSTNYLWQFGDGNGSTVTNPVHDYNTPGTYTITLGLIDPICRDTTFSTQSVTIGLPSLPIDLGEAPSLCDGGSVLLDAGAGFDSYEWSTGAITSTLSVVAPGTYSVSVSDGFCTGGDTIIVTGPLSHTSVPDLSICPGEERTILLPDPVTAILWNTGSTSTGLSIVDEGIYWFDAIDAGGCPWTDTVVVTIIVNDVGAPIIPNVFSPNGDLQNDLYLVTGVDAEEFELEVYNRWGMKMFSTINVNVGWNGRLDNGSEPVPDGTYYYILTYKDDCAQVPLTTLTGHITVLR